METTRIIGGIAFVAAFFAASLLALWITGCIERSRHGSEAALLSGADSSRMQHLLRNGIPSLKPLSNELLKIRVIERFIKRLQNALAERDTETYPQSLASLLLGGALAILILGSALSASFVFALTALICALLFLNSWITKQQDSYHARLREELPSAIQAMNACFCIGYSLPGDLRASCPRPRRTPETGLPKERCSSGRRRAVEEALEVLKSQTHEPELFFLATALEYPTPHWKQPLTGLGSRTPIGR